MTIRLINVGEYFINPDLVIYITPYFKDDNYFYFRIGLSGATQEIYVNARTSEEIDRLRLKIINDITTESK